MEGFPWFEFLKFAVNAVIVPMVILLWKINTSIHKLELLISNEYVKKTDFSECQKTCEKRFTRLHDRIERA